MFSCACVNCCNRPPWLVVAGLEGCEVEKKTANFSVLPGPPLCSTALHSSRSKWASVSLCANLWVMWADSLSIVINSHWFYSRGWHTLQRSGFKAGALHVNWPFTTVKNDFPVSLSVPYCAPFYRLLIMLMNMESCWTFKWFVLITIMTDYRPEQGQLRPSKQPGSCQEFN